MGRLSTFLFGMVLGGVGVYVGLKYHIVRTDQGIEYFAKSEATFRDTFVDLRKMPATEWANHKELAIAMTKAGRHELLGQGQIQSVKDSVSQFEQSVSRAISTLRQ
jgi:hypothetical protein